MSKVVILLFFSMAILSLLLIKWKFRLIGYLNIIDPNVGYYTVRFFGYPIHFGKFQVYNSKLFVTLKNSKRKKLTISATNKDSVSIVSFLDNAFFTIADIRRLDYFFKAGNSRNAFHTAIACGQLQILSSILNGIAKERYPKLESINGVEADFVNDIIQLSFSGIFYMSLIEIFYGIIYALKRTIRQNRKLRAKKKNKEAV